MGVSAGLVLAAGEGRRFGGPKQLAVVAGRPLVEHALAALAGLERVVVVLGARAEEIRAGADSAAPRSSSAGTGRRGWARRCAPGSRRWHGAGEVVVCSPTSRSSGRAVVDARARGARRRGRAPLRRRARAIPSCCAGRCWSAPASCAATRASATCWRGAAEVECGDLADPSDIDTRATWRWCGGEAGAVVRGRRADRAGVDGADRPREGRAVPAGRGDHRPRRGRHVPRHVPGQAGPDDGVLPRHDPDRVVRRRGAHGDASRARAATSAGRAARTRRSSTRCTRSTAAGRASTR